MKIALDYDQTFTLDPDFWLAFIQTAKVTGHDVRIVTVRDYDHDRTHKLIELEQHIQIFYTAGVAKKWFLSHFGDGFTPDIWIDDKPQSILENSNATPDFLVEWRRVRDH